MLEQLKKELSELKTWVGNEVASKEEAPAEDAKSSNTEGV